MGGRTCENVDGMERQLRRSDAAGDWWHFTVEHHPEAPPSSDFPEEERASAIRVASRFTNPRWWHLLSRRG